MSEATVTAFRAPDDAQAGAFSDDRRPLSPTTQVAAIKGSFGKAVGQAQLGDSKSAIQTLTPVLTFLKGPDVNLTESREFAFWSEQVLAKAAVLASNAIHKHLYTDDNLPDFTLEAFRLWSVHPNVQHKSPAVTDESDIPGCIGSPATVWRAYYDFLSEYLRRDLFTSLPGERPNRSPFLEQFRKVQDSCKTMVLSNTKFPTADEENQYVEDWIEEVITNWKILCGPSWQSSDIKNGGQNAISISVLDILYAAAAKTFHSLLILRRLFHLHSALADFDLAMSALDTYITLYDRNKERAKKTSAYTRTTENDETFGRTVCEAILMLCCFGRLKEAERAKDLAEMVRDDILNNLSGSLTPENSAFFHRAIGVGLANWARWTPVNESRADIQVSALGFLQKSLAAGTKGQKDLNAAYSLGLLLAETRNLQVAIEVVREALQETDPFGSSRGNDNQLSPFMLQRYTLPLWHLLTLLLSAQQNFEAAYRACEAGLQVVDAICFSPERQPNRALNESDAVSSRSWVAPAEEVLRVEIEAREKERIIEFRMTQISLDEMLDGPNTAAQSIDSLLSMFHKLFDDINLDAQNAQSALTETPRTHLQPPPVKSAAASSRGSIFSRRKSFRSTKVPETRQPPEMSEKPTKVKLSKSQAERHGLGVLIKLYIFIARIRRHAKQFDEAEKACFIAEKYATCIEELVARPEGAFPHGFEDEKWGFCQVPDELWADVFAERGALSQERSRPREAIKHYEEALIYSPDHLAAIVGLCNLLLDSSDESLSAENVTKVDTSLSDDLDNLTLAHAPLAHKRTPQPGLRNADINLPNDNDPTPETLDRLAARDRAFGLLSTLTRLGTAWDNSEAWFALARAYEQGGQLEKAREILWWCIELEDKKPIRHWWNLGSGGYVL